MPVLDVHDALQEWEESQNAQNVVRSEKEHAMMLLMFFTALVTPAPLSGKSPSLFEGLRYFKLASDVETFAQKKVWICPSKTWAGPAHFAWLIEVIYRYIVDNSIKMIQNASHSFT